jgi:magnesium chelatase family protein
MLARVGSAALSGIEAATVFVEVDVASGLPSFTTVGLPDSTVRESRDRIRAAIRNAGFEFPADRITVNLAPADLRKEGAAFDLPMALGILCATGLVKPDRLERALVLGELSLDGCLRPVKGVLSVALHCRQKGLGPLIVPTDNAAEASVVSGVEVIPVLTIHDAVEYLNGERLVGPVRADAARRLAAWSPTAWTSPMCAATRMPRASRSRRPAATTSSWSGCRERARPCLPGGSPPSCRR